MASSSKHGRVQRQSELGEINLHSENLQNKSLMHSCIIHEGLGSWYSYFLHVIVITNIEVHSKSVAAMEDVHRLDTEYGINYLYYPLLFLY